MTSPLPTPPQFYIDLPLYEELTFSVGYVDAAYKIIFFRGPMDAYCPECGSHSIFTRAIDVVPHVSVTWNAGPYFVASFKCSRDVDHILRFWVRVDKDAQTLQKIGQYPSLASLSMYDVRKYATVLEKNLFRELTKAIGLAAHGVGVGSFVYLRRIFEGLVEEAHLVAKNEAAWDDELYGKSRMGEKIELLANFLPAFLVENKTMYGILSKGVHELTEVECLAAFPVVKIGIEIILDAKIQSAAERKKLEVAKLAIQNLASQGVK